MSSFTIRRLAAGGAVTSLLLAGCSAVVDGPLTGTDSDAVTVSDQWVKAAESGMSSAFAQLSNIGDRDVRIVAVSSPASARAELHEVTTRADGTAVMRQKQGGMTVPANSTHTLVPGGDHLMLLDLTDPLAPGMTTTLSLIFEDGSTMSFDAQVRDFSGNQKSYDPTGGHGSAPAAAPMPGHGA
ncbi:copper chaperone PCu(A)C [Rhodococcus marinonascens]|uniref:copper chaperone PCu(A)C n=1 Tax=Rhodococcus marinonascens TaxID=38311 RepID=UPI000A4E3578|nr:copper chaperone PCu(A)C [Rhodococcus marinonascens]